MADKVSYSTLQTWIPELTWYRFTTAKKHTLVKGRGITLTPEMRTKMAVPQHKLDHF